MSDLVRVEPPYVPIWDALKSGLAVPFLGAGASLCGRPEGQAWDVKASDFFPSGSELASSLARAAGLSLERAHETPDLAKVASFYIAQSNRRWLRHRLQEVFNRPCQIGAVHRFLAEIDVPLLIVTTNYDDLIEQAFQERGRPFHLVIHATDLPENKSAVLWQEPGASKPKPTNPIELNHLFDAPEAIIYKMHGSVDRQQVNSGSYVITEEDYVDFLSRMAASEPVIPGALAARFRYASFLFLGYSLSDWNLRVLLRNLRSRPSNPDVNVLDAEQSPPPGQEEQKHWAIQRHPTAMEYRLWQTRDVLIFDIDLDTFVARMREESD